MSFAEVLFYIGGFAFLWLFVVLLSAVLDRALRRLFNFGIWPEGYFNNEPISRDLTHCPVCQETLADRNFCRTCGDV